MKLLCRKIVRANSLGFVRRLEATNSKIFASIIEHVRGKVILQNNL